MTRDAVAWVDLDTAANIEPAVDAWREAVTSGKEVPGAVPAKVRALVWERVRKELPAGTKTVYICPDAALCKVPVGALSGDKPGTVVLEDFALGDDPARARSCSISSGPGIRSRPPSPPRFVVGGVKYSRPKSPGCRAPPHFAGAAPRC